MPLQAQLLRVVQERTYKRVGSNTWQRTDFRLVCATNRDLARGPSTTVTFRSDLYYRIASWVFAVPPLRERTRGHPAAGAAFPADVPSDIDDRSISRVRCASSCSTGLPRQCARPAAADRRASAAAMSAPDRSPSATFPRTSVRRDMPASAGATAISSAASATRSRSGAGLKEISHAAADMAIARRARARRTAICTARPAASGSPTARCRCAARPGDRRVGILMFTAPPAGRARDRGTRTATARPPGAVPHAQAAGGAAARSAGGNCRPAPSRSSADDRPSARTFASSTPGCSHGPSEPNRIFAAPARSTACSSSSNRRTPDVSV